MNKILVIDDDHDLSGTIKAVLEYEKYTVFLSHSGEDGILQAEELEPNLILLDIMMPGVHGVEVLRRIKRIHPDIKAIMITAVDDKDIASEAMAEGAADYVTKPLDLNYLDALVTFQVMG